MVRDYKPVDRTSNASGYNSKLPKFNSRFLQPRTDAVNAFSQDCSMENNWLAPPTLLIGRSLSHLSDYEVIGTLIVLMWKSAQFWLLLCDDGIHLNLFATNCFFLPDRTDLFVSGRAKNTLSGTKLLKSRFSALRIDFAEYVRVSKVGFCTTPMGWCSL